MTMDEGVTKFRQYHTLDEPTNDYISELIAWRQLLFSYGLIGQNPERYGGAGYGNVSQRFGPFDNPLGKRKFVITGTQIGGLANLMAEHFATVLEYSPKQNLVVSRGPIKASSESMTHGTIYDLDDSARFAFHVHSSEMWNRADELGMPVTSEYVEYGTPEMAEEVKKLFAETDVMKKKIFSMGGHEDGVVGFGRTGLEAGFVLLNYYQKSLG